MKEVQEVSKEDSTFIMRENEHHKMLSREIFDPFYDAHHSDAMSETLMEYVAWGNQAEAEAMLESIKDDKEKLFDLLCTKVVKEVKGPSDKVLKGLTPFQAALCAGDVEMCEMLKDYFFEIAHDLGEIQEQFVEIFSGEPDAHVEHQIKEAKNFKEILDNLIETMIAASDDEVKTMLEKKQADSELGQAFSTFRNKVEAINDSDLVFNPYYLLNTFEIYTSRFDDFTSCAQQNLFCIQVIGFMERYLPACYLQAFAQSIYDLVKNGSPLRRSFKFKFVFHGVQFLETGPANLFSGLGFDYYACRPPVERGGGWGSCVRLGVDSCWAQAHEYRTFCQTKAKYFQNLYNTVFNDTSQCCVIM